MALQGRLGKYHIPASTVGIRPRSERSCRVVNLVTDGKKSGILFTACGELASPGNGGRNTPSEPLNSSLRRDEAEQQILCKDTELFAGFLLTRCRPSGAGPLRDAPFHGTAGATELTLSPIRTRSGFPLSSSPAEEPLFPRPSQRKTMCDPSGLD